LCMARYRTAKAPGTAIVPITRMRLIATTPNPSVVAGAGIFPATPRASLGPSSTALGSGFLVQSVNPGCEMLTRDNISEPQKNSDLSE
jgi:hypothetical protein